MTEQGQPVWRIPVEDLIAAGLKLHSPTITGEADDGVTEVGPDLLSEYRREADELRARISSLEMDLVRARAERDSAQAIAEERARTIDLLSAVTRALNAATPPPKRRFWQRKAAEDGEPTGQTQA